MKLIKITSIYGEEFIRKEIERNKQGVLTDKGFIPLHLIEDIQYIDIIEEEEENK